MSIWEIASDFWLAFLVTTLAAWPIYTALRSRSKQKISEFAPEAHQAKQGTPTMGGLMIVVGLLAAAAKEFFSAEHHGGLSWWTAALALTAGFALIGYTDDYLVPKFMPGKRGLGWKQKLVMELVVAVGGAYLIFPGGWPFAICVFCILFFSNAYNFADGLDALAGTLLLGIAGGILGISALTLTDTTTAPLMAALCGAVIPFLYLNAPPAKVFMGDVGSLPIGALLGAAVAELAFRGHFGAGDDKIWGMDLSVVIGLKVLSLIMAIELIPVPLQILWVKLFKKRLFPFTPIHHAFEKAGWKETRVVALFALTQLLLSILAVTLVATT